MQQTDLLTEENTPERFRVAQQGALQFRRGCIYFLRELQCCRTTLPICITP